MFWDTSGPVPATHVSKDGPPADPFTDRALSHVSSRVADVGTLFPAPVGEAGLALLPDSCLHGRCVQFRLSASAAPPPDGGSVWSKAVEVDGPSAAHVGHPVKERSLLAPVPGVVAGAAAVPRRGGYDVAVVSREVSLPGSPSVIHVQPRYLVLNLASADVAVRQSGVSGAPVTLASKCVAPVYWADLEAARKLQIRPLAR